MEFIEHDSEDGKAIEIVSEKILIESEQDALDILAGAVMQKFSNYRVRVAIIGNFTGYGESMDAFIRECNRSKQVVFTPGSSSALKMLKGYTK